MLSFSRVAVYTLFFSVLSLNFINAQCLNNALENPSFESNLDSWDTNGPIIVTNDAFAGNHAVEIPGDGNRIYQTKPVQEGQVVRLRGQAKKTGANGDANIGIKFLDGSYGLIEVNYATLDDISNYESFGTIESIAPPQSAFVEVTAFTNAASSAIIVDDFCLEIEGSGSGPKPDLIITNLRGDFFINAGDPFDLTFDLGNIGQQIANGDLQVGVYISGDDQFDASDQEMIVENYSNTPIGGTFDLTAVFTTPNTLAPGNHYLFVIADIQNQILESNEDNNQTFRILEVGGLNPDPCAIDISVIDGSIQCDDNNTDDNPDDDLWSFQLLIENSLNPDADGWKTEIAGQTYQGEYDVVQTISNLSIAQGPVSFLVIDLNDNSCEKEFLNLTPPFPCSNVMPPTPCAIEISIVDGSIQCDDNNTDDNPNDDLWSFEFSVENTLNPNADGWSTEIGGENIEGDYGEVKSISGLNIANGAISFLVKDNQDNSCEKEFLNLTPPSTCSNVTPPPSCDIQIVVDLNSIQCDDNGTNSDPSDDTWSFSFEVNNSNFLFNAWEATINGQTIEGNYGDTKTATGLSIANGAIDFSVTDIDDPSCVETVFGIQPPVACSNVTPPSNDDPDLTIIDLDVNQMINIGSSVNTQVSVSNIGLGLAAGSFTMEYFISNDQFLSLDDTNLKVHTFGNFGPNSNVNVGISFSIPNSILEGDYFLITFVDAQDDIDESNESNNVFVNSIRIEDVVTPPSGICEPYSLFPWQDYIGKVKINEEGFSSGKSEYSDFRNIIFDVPLLEPNAIELTAFFSWQNYDEYFSVYIDFDQDGVYQMDELYHQGMIEAKANGTEKNKLFSGPFNINPPNALTGLTTMRVMMSRDGFAEPCDVLDFGEVEDYSVNVVEELTYNPYMTREDFNDEQLFVYPNPTFDYVNVNLFEAFGQEGILMLVDRLGKIVKKENLKQLSEDTFKMTVKELSEGLYTMYLVQDGKRSKHAKVVVMDSE